MDLPITRPSLDEEELAAVEGVLRSGWVTQGPEVEAFEGEVAAFVGAKHACAVSNCTAGLHMALLALGVGPADEVITVSHSFIATANVIRYCGAVPVFVDIDPSTYNIDPKLIERAITPRTRLVLCVHQMGMPCDLEQIRSVVDAHHLLLVEDAACAVGSEIRKDDRWERIGRPHGQIACFSFHPRKLLTTGEGGMLTTNDDGLCDRLRLLRHQGMSVSDTVRHRAQQVTFESYPLVGYNYRMTDIQAAIGRVQLRKLPALVARRRELVQRYRELLGEIPGLIVPSEPAWARSNWQSFCVRLPPGVDQVEVMQSLLDRGIATRRGIMCTHREPAYRGEPWICGAAPESCRGGPSCQHLSSSEAAQDRSVILPLFHDMSEDDPMRVATALREVCSCAASV